MSEEIFYEHETANIINDPKAEFLPNFSSFLKMLTFLPRIARCQNCEIKSCKTCHFKFFILSHKQASIFQLL